MLANSRFLNCFQHCSKALQVLGSVMVLLVVALVAFSWYAVVPLCYGPYIFGDSILKAILSGLACVLYTALNVMVLWCYFAAVTTDPGRVPSGWHPFVDDQQAAVELERLAYSDYYVDRRDPRRPRFCKRCQAWKPERSHHCSVSGHCILRMDHYCIWVINCVGLLNYKHFLLFLFYVALGSLATFFLLLSSLIKFFKGHLFGPTTPMVFIAAVINFSFALAVSGFIIMHLQMIGANCTTIEMYEKERVHPWPYNKGFRRNFEEVFGRSKPRWLLPSHTKEERRQLLDSCLSQTARLAENSPLLGA
ncbi:hypothetical protein FOA52_006136 [Chlamydomonas sp. UWO 241]|nr:hypothetical protein FOA52_006136 [Chlamydomonas sp. UWO 241]